MKMIGQERVLLVDPLRSRASLLKRALRDNSYDIVAQVSDVSMMLQQARVHRPDFLVLGIDLPDTETLKQLVLLKQQWPLPVICFAEKDTPQIIEQVVKAGISAFIVDDIQAQRFPSIISVAIARFREQQGMIKELESTRSKLAERKVLERAKGLLMEQRNMTEEEAYASLRKMAMDKGRSIVSVAENIIEVLRLFESPKQN